MGFAFRTTAQAPPDWKAVKVPDVWKNPPAGIDNLSWYRAFVKAPEAWKGKDLELFVEPTDAAHEILFNGKKVGSAGEFPPFFRSGLGGADRFFVPADAASGAVDVTTLTAHDHGGAATDTATDTTTVHVLGTYPNPGYGVEEHAFTPGETVYGCASGLSAFTQVYFVWRAPGGGIVRTSPTRDVDTEDKAYDNYALGPTAPATKARSPAAARASLAAATLISCTRSSSPWRARRTRLPPKVLVSITCAPAAR